MKIIVKHSSIVIEGYTWNDSDKLQSIFSVYDRLTHQSFPKAIEYVEEENKLILPRGIDVYYLENLFGVNAILDNKHDEYDHIENVKIKYLPRDEDQKTTLKFMLGESVQYKHNKYKSQLSVNLNPGAGKSYCSIATMSYLGIRSAVITSSINWLEQWKNYIMEYTNIKANEIYLISGSASIFSLLKKDINKFKVILISHSTIKSYGDKHGWDKVTDLFKFMRIGLKFYDEAHLNFDNMCRIDFHTNTFKTYYVSATPARSSEEENRIFQLYFKNIPAIDLFDEDKDPRTKYISLLYNSHPSPQEISDCKNQYGLDRNKYTNYIINKENYYRILTMIIDMAMSVEGKVLIYIGTQYAIDKTKEWIMKNYWELWSEVGVYTSAVTYNKETQLDKKIILSTTKSCGAAMDIKDLKMTVVLAEPFKSEVIARQSLGRTRARDTIYIEVVDKGFFYTNKYYLEKQPVFEKYATSCTEVKLSDIDLMDKVKQVRAKRRAIFNPPLVTFMKKDELIKPVQFMEGKLFCPVSFTL